MHTARGRELEQLEIGQLSLSHGLGGLSIGLFGLPHNMEVSRQLDCFMAAGGFRS